MRVRAATGPVAEALRRLRGIRVRWSFERKKWAVEQKVLSKRFLVPPVVYVPHPTIRGYQVPSMLPELSDRFISYHDSYDIILWAGRLNWGVYRAVAMRDWTRRGTNKDALRHHDHVQEAKGKAKEKSQAELRRERTEEAYSRLRHLNEKHPEMDPVGAKNW